MNKWLLTMSGPGLKYAMMAVLLLPGAAIAGGKASLLMDHVPAPTAGQPMSGEVGTATVTWRDADTVRMDFDDQNSYILMRQGKVYSVSGSGGETQVMSMSVVRKMVQSMGKSGTRNPFGNVDSVEVTGATEIVAGIKGRAYHMTWTDGAGNRKSGSAVLTDDPLVVEMTRLYIGMMAGMVGEETTLAFQNALPGKRQGLLRMGDQFRVDSIRSADPPASTFALPAKPMDMQSLMGGMGGR